ncbi:hypothetical protein K458DRAFT_203114 [Lentithecium fluviatile CBS 122367]|uniref:Uncharacterized protein n=1 Tax=Lentithecium fluviatile CBS 122367 TaxID=1168545 RepID=A0A6G1J9E4_9PLEO|nr:hypothetical protein K458DRAFT_203114 [Lentithecium fluviatile CBS 122367]
MPRATAKKRVRFGESTAAFPNKARRAAKSPHGEVPEDQEVEQLMENSAITLRNQQQSPLLRLPAELRERIWTLAFGARTIHPITSRRYLCKGVGQISYHVCWERLSDQDIYDLGRQGAAENDAFTWKAEELYEGKKYARYRGWAGVHDCADGFGAGWKGVPEVRLLVPRVCKQLYYEATPLMWKTTTLCFMAPWDFQDFVKAQRAAVALVQHLTLCPNWERNGWDAALTPQAVGAFASLQDLHLVIVAWDWDEREFDVMKSPPSYLRHMTNLVTQFQALPLKKESTTVWVTGHRDPYARGVPTDGFGVPDSRPRFSVEERRAVAERIRGLLLDWRPRRRTGRGRA